MEAGRLLDLLRKSTEEIIGGEARVAVAYSGGVDSSIIARIAAELCEVNCYTSAAPNSYDARNVTALAAIESLALTIVIIDCESLMQAVGKASTVLGSDDPVKIAYTVPLMLVIEKSNEPLVLVGSGADELFAGYKKYLSLEDPKSAMEDDLRKMLDEEKRLCVWATSVRKRLGYPFASNEVICFARQIPLSEKMSDVGGKLILREVAKLLGLGALARPKKAAQYSSGVMKQMERLAKNEGMSLRAWVKEIASKEKRSS